MTLILQGTTKTKDLIIDYIEVQLSSGMHCSVKYVYDQKYLALQKLRRLLGGEPHGK